MGRSHIPLIPSPPSVGIHWPFYFWRTGINKWSHISMSNSLWLCLRSGVIRWQYPFHPHIKLGYCFYLSEVETWLKFICSKAFKLPFFMKRVDSQFPFCGIFVCTAILIFICKSSMFTLVSSSGQRLCMPVQISVVFFFCLFVFLYRYYCSTFVYCFNTCNEGSVHGF